VSVTNPSGQQTAPQLRRVMGFWDVLLFNIATVLGPRWIAAAAHNGQSSISLWVIAAVIFFVPSAVVITELSTRFPHEGGLYVWSKEAFGDFHGFIAGWTYWIYTFFYFPGLLLASAAMAAYVGGTGTAWLAQSRTFLLVGSFALLAVAVTLNIIGLNIGKWLQNAGGVATYIPLIILVVVAAILYHSRGSATHFSWAGMLPHWNLGTVNFWSQIAFAFTGLELASAMSDEIRDPKRTFPRAILGSGVLIALIYIAGTIAVLTIVPAATVDAKSGVFQAIGFGSTALRVAAIGMLAAALVTIGNAGGVGSTVAGIARVPFVVGIDRYLPAVFGKTHPRWKTPYVAILVQAGISGIILLVTQINQTASSAYQILVDAAIILYFIPFVYMYAAVIKLAYRADRETQENTVLIPGGKAGAWIVGGMWLVCIVLGIALSFIPPGEVTNKFAFEAQLIGGTAGSVAIGLGLYFRVRILSFLRKTLNKLRGT
jgi:amino acid transporter